MQSLQEANSKSLVINSPFDRQKIFMRTVLSLLICIFLASGCATYRLDEAQNEVRSSFATHNFDKTIDLLNKYERKNIYKSRDKVLYNLEMGTASHFSTKYDSSTYYFTQAEEEMDALFSKSISRGLASFLFANDNTLSYNGESYEDVYLNAFKSLNFIHRGDLEGALVEARRMSYKLSRLEEKYKGVAQSLAKADTLDKGKWKAGKSNIQNSALGHYLSSVLYAKSGKPDDARIEYENLLEALSEQSGSSLGGADKESLQKIKNTDAYNVLLVGFAGRAPIKYQNDVRLYLDKADLYLKFSLPELRLYDSRVNRINAVINDSTTVPLQLIEQMDIVAKEVYKIKEPIIYTRAFVRSLTKALGTNAAGGAIEKENEGLGILLNILGKVSQEFTEKADTRAWQTMPGKAYVTTLQLPPGNHQIQIKYLDDLNNVLFTREARIKINENENLELLETLYWN